VSTRPTGAYVTFPCEAEGCSDSGPEFCSGCVAEGLHGASDDCRFENPSARVYLDHCATCSCQDRVAEAHAEGFVACGVHRLTVANRGEHAHG
jgi:hypothetical protein